MKLDVRSSETAKRRRTCLTQSYKSPLVHLRKSSARRCPQTTSDDLDDSVVVLEEVTHNPALLAGKRKRTVSPDDSVIILSDNEENEAEKETDVQLPSLQTVVEDNLSGVNSAPTGVVKGRSKIEPRVKTKTTVTRSTTLENKSSMLGMCPKSDTVELQSISIDSEDENGIPPNDDSSKSHPQDEIIIIDNSGIEEANGISMSNISSSFSAVGSSRSATTRADASPVFTPRKEFQIAAETFALLCLAKNKHTHRKCPSFCIDTKGDPSLVIPCFGGKSDNMPEANGNWIKCLESISSKNYPWKKSNNVENQAVGIESCHRVQNSGMNGRPEISLRNESTVVANESQCDGVGSCQKGETAATNGSPECSLPIKLTVVANEAQVDGIESCQGKESAMTNRSVESSRSHKLNVVLKQPKAYVVLKQPKPILIGGSSSGKTTVTDRSSKTLPRKKKKAQKRAAQANVTGAGDSEIIAAMNREQSLPRNVNSNFCTNQPSTHIMGSYYSEQTVVNLPGSLREIIIDGCNVATQYTKGKYFSEEGLKLVIDYFALRGHTVKAFVPQHVRSMKHVILERLYSDGIVVFTPSRQIGYRRISSYDDRYILDYAAMSDGIVVSQDQYRDLYMEKPVWRRIIEERLLVPTFVGKCVMFPEDPLGRHGPTLDQFLRHY